MCCEIFSGSGEFVVKSVDFNIFLFIYLPMFIQTTIASNFQKIHIVKNVHTKFGALNNINKRSGKADLSENVYLSQESGHVISWEIPHKVRTD